MIAEHTLIGREREQAALGAAISAIEEGKGGLILLAGEAGVGKTRLAEETFKTTANLLILHGETGYGATPPYGPIVTALRAYQRTNPDRFSQCGALVAHLALLLPELGPAREQGDRATLFEAMHCAFHNIARQRPTIIFLDDLQWADTATLEFLPALVTSLEKEPLLIVGAYRNDEIPRGHPLRHMRTDLRRRGRLREIVLEPLSCETTAALAAHILGGPLSPSLVATLYDRTDGVPFFVKELVSALAARGLIREEKNEFELVTSDQLPIPETVRDAVLVQVERLAPETRSVLDVAAVIGMHFDLDLLADLGSAGEISEAVQYGLIVEVEPDQAAFRHALTREAIYGEIDRNRRRALHREIAARLEARKAPPIAVAEHWLVGREMTKARLAFIQAAEFSCIVHAYHDAARALLQALEFWPQGEDEALRIDVLDRLGLCAELCGDLPEASRVWREVAENRRAAGETVKFAETQRRLAVVYELQGLWEKVLEARQFAADAFEDAQLHGEGAAERLAVALHLHAAGRFSTALQVSRISIEQAERAERLDLKARALALQGAVLGKLGQFESASETARAGLSLSLEKNLIASAAEAHQRLASILEQAGDYTAARDAYQRAFEFCEARGVSPMAQFCLACLTVVLRDTGEWDQAITLCKKVLASNDAQMSALIVARGMLGSIYARRGQTRRARGPLMESYAQARQIEMAPMELENLWGLAYVDALQEEHEAATDKCRSLLKRWEQTEDRHYIVPALRWTATYFAEVGAEPETRACANALASIASALGQAEALAALAHALGEVALLEGDTLLAAQQFSQALEMLRNLELPFERVQIQLRAGVALVAAGQREVGIQRLTDAYRIARKLKASPIAQRAAKELAMLGEKIEQRLGRGAITQLKFGGLSRRELEMLHYIALGRTNREIAQALFLSTRTVDMHVRNVLNKLNCRSRVEAIRKAEEFGLLT